MAADVKPMSDQETVAAAQRMVQEAQTRRCKQCGQPRRLDEIRICDVGLFCVACRPYRVRRSKTTAPARQRQEPHPVPPETALLPAPTWTEDLEDPAPVTDGDK